MAQCVKSSRLYLHPNLFTFLVRYLIYQNLRLCVDILKNFYTPSSNFKFDDALQPRRNRLQGYNPVIALVVLQTRLRIAGSSCDSRYGGSNSLFK